MRNRIIVALMLIAGVAVAGYVHDTTSSGSHGSKTSYSQSATPASCFMRDGAGDVLPLCEVTVFQETLFKVVGVTTNTVVNTGFWTVDANGDYFPTTSTGDYANRGILGERYDVEWDVDSSGNVFPKE